MKPGRSHGRRKAPTRSLRRGKQEPSPEVSRKMRVEVIKPEIVESKIVVESKPVEAEFVESVKPIDEPKRKTGCDQSHPIRIGPWIIGHLARRVIHLSSGGAHLG